MTAFEALLDGIADIRSHPGRTMLQTIGIILGVASIVACLTIVDANRTSSLKFFEKFGGLRKILVRTDMPRTIRQTARERGAKGLRLSDVERLKAEGRFFDIVDPVVGASALIKQGTFSKEEWVQGITPAFAEVYQLAIARGRFISERDVQTAARVIVLGDTRARRIFGGEDPLGRIVSVDGQGFEVIGVLVRREHFFGGGGRRRGGGNALEWMNEYTLVPLTAVTRRLRGDPDSRIGYMNIMAKSADDADEAIAEIERILLREHDGVRDFHVYDRRDRMQRMQQQMMAFNVTFIVSAAVSLLVGGIVITNILLASFRTRVREVGVRKALGASGGHVFIHFLVESVVVTSVAGVLGLFLGKLFSVGVSKLTGTTSDVSITTLLVAFSVAVLVGIVFGFYPALRAARLQPVEALRYE